MHNKPLLNKGNAEIILFPILFLSFVPVVESSSSQHHRIVIGPLGGIAPALLVDIPEMAPGWISHNPLRETLPNSEGKIHLRDKNPSSDLTSPFSGTILIMCGEFRDKAYQRCGKELWCGATHLNGGEHSVLVQTQHGICYDGAVGQESAAHHLETSANHSNNLKQWLWGLSQNLLTLRAQLKSLLPHIMFITVESFGQIHTPHDGCGKLVSTEPICGADLIRVKC